ncbi:MAG: S8 family peptidase [Anaerolineae bacterium]|nr:S8 family peptidase [Anaerolineae bacterium]
MDESKLAPDLLSRLREPHALEAAVPPVPVIIKYGPDAMRSQTVAEGIEARYVYKLTPTVATIARGTDILDLTDDESIEYIWYDEEIHTCLDRSLPQIQVPAVWAAGYRGTGIKIAIVDTGIDPAHPDFAGRIVAGASFVGGDYGDENGHGTHVASTAAGSGAAQGGRYQGAAPEATLFIARTLDRNGSGSMSGVMAGVEWAVEQSVQVINLSLGGSGSSDGQDALSLTCNAAVARGIVVCVAAGNAGPGSRTIGSPGAAADAITVGAVTREDGVASFSSRGPTADGRPKPDICFPGTDIVAARAAGTSMGGPVDERYTAASGTSMATPHAAGVAALLLQAVPGLTPVQVKEALLATALNLGQDQNAQGAGRAQAEHALRRVQGDEPPEPPPEEPEPPPKKDGCLPTFLTPLIGR